MLSINNAIASLAVRDLSAAMPWYADLLSQEVDSTPMPTLAEWKFPHGGWLQVYEQPERAGSGSCTLAVNNIDAIAAHAASLGIDTGQRSDTDKVRTLMISDPDGNHIAFAQALDRHIAR
jgi:predicted enzyme related to lactoylglutathione lyase